MIPAQITTNVLTPNVVAKAKEVLPPALYVECTVEGKPTVAAVKP